MHFSVSHHLDNQFLFILLRAILKKVRCVVAEGEIRRI